MALWRAEGVEFSEAAERRVRRCGRRLEVLGVLAPGRGRSRAGRRRRGPCAQALQLPALWAPRTPRPCRGLPWAPTSGVLRPEDPGADAPGWGPGLPVALPAGPSFGVGFNGGSKWGRQLRFSLVSLLLVHFCWRPSP